jgi:hypothetical protein
VVEVSMLSVPPAIWMRASEAFAPSSCTVPVPAISIDPSSLPASIANVPPLNSSFPVSFVSQAAPVLEEPPPLKASVLNFASTVPLFSNAGVITLLMFAVFWKVPVLTTSEIPVPASIASSKPVFEL